MLPDAFAYASAILRIAMASPTPASGPETDPGYLPDYSEDGVDLSLIRWMLSLTPLERLEFAEQQANSILKIWELNGRA